MAAQLMLFGGEEKTCHALARGGRSAGMEQKKEVGPCEFGYTKGGVERQSLTAADEAELAPMTTEELRAFIAANYWKFASSMPQHPHYYVTRDKANSLIQWKRFVAHIRRVGVARSFFRIKLKYLDLDGWTYWTMGYPLERTPEDPESLEGILNRAKLPA